MFDYRDGTNGARKYKEGEEKVNEVIYTDWGVANTYSDGTIELHKDLQLPKYTALREAILKHEQAHSFDKGFWYNVKVELTETVGTFSLLRFMVSRPKTWRQVLPLYWTKKRGIVYDTSLIFFWASLALSFSLFMIIKSIGGI